MKKIHPAFLSALRGAPDEIRSMQKKRTSLRYKLFRYMLFLSAILIAAFLIGFSVLSAAAVRKNNFRSTLRMQMTVFSEDLSSGFDTLEMWGLQMSASLTDVIREYLNGHHMSFSEINDSQTALASLQEASFGILCEKLLQTDSSGVFLMLDATVNTTLPEADRSRSGLYIRKNSPSDSISDLLLYHGNPDIGKEHGVMPHRRWTLEFQPEALPGFENWKKNAVSGSCSFSDIFVLPGTPDIGRRRLKRRKRPQRRLLQNPVHLQARPRRQPRQRPRRHPERRPESRADRSVDALPPRSPLLPDLQPRRTGVKALLQKPAARKKSPKPPAGPEDGARRRSLPAPLPSRTARPRQSKQNPEKTA